MQVLAAAEALAITATGAWTEVDLTAAPYSVPATATFALLHVVLRKTTTPGIVFQVRSAASSQGIYGVGGEETGMVATTMSVLAPLSAGKFDYYSSGTTAGGAIEVAVIGYFSALDGVAFNSSIDITPTDPLLPSQHPLLEGWKTINVSAYVPSTHNLAVCSYHDSAFSPDKLSQDVDEIRHAFDVRLTGGSAVISESADQYSGSAVGSNPTQYFLAPLTASGDFDIYGNARNRVDNTVTRTLLLHGYLKATLNAAPTTTDRNVFVAPSSDAWLERTASVAARAVLVYFANNASWNAVLGYRMKGELGAHTTAMQSTQVARGIQQGIIPLDGNSKWEEWEEYSGTYSGYRSYTVAYFLTEELLEESAAVTDTLRQDLYTRGQAETVAVTDVLSAGDVRGGVVTEEAPIVDAATAERIKGGTAGESAAAVDTVEVEHTSTAAAGTPGETSTEVNITNEGGEGLFGGVGAGASEVDVSGSGEGLAGAVGSGGGSVGVDGDGVGLHGNAADGDGRVSVTGSGTGLTVPAAEATVEGEQYQTFAMNLMTGAVTSHSTVFNSRSVCGGKTYAAGPDGIHVIEGAADAGTPIALAIAKSGIDGGSRMIKRPTDFFFRMASTGNFNLTVFSEGKSGSVVLTDGISKVHGSKANLPKGVLGAEHGFLLTNVDGANLLNLPEAELVFMFSDKRRGRQAHG